MAKAAQRRINSIDLGIAILLRWGGFGGQGYQLAPTDWVESDTVSAGALGMRRLVDWGG